MKKYNTPLRVEYQWATTYPKEYQGLTVFSWNCQGCANPKFPRIFREYNREYKPDIVSFLETRVSGFKADKIIANLGFKFSHKIEVIGFSRGIWVG